MNSLVKSLGQFWNSSIGKKIVVALTGIMLVGFLLGHMVGNLLVFAGRGALNDYAEFLHSFGHKKGIWIARIGLLVSIVLHILATISLTLHNRKSRNESYANDATLRASRSSRIMAISGIIILVFIVFHILHFTVRIDPKLADMKDQFDTTVPIRHDVYGMVIKGFQSIPVSLFYIVAITLLCSHLSHGISSIFQTLGLRSRKTAQATKIISWATTAVIWIGFLIVPVSIMFGLKKDSGEAGHAAIEQPVETKQSAVSE